VLRRDVGTPDAVALLEPQRVDRLVAAGDQALIPPGRPELVPESRAELGRAVELPAELADIGDAYGEARHRPDRQFLRRHVPKRLVGEIRSRQGLEYRPALRAHGTPH